MAQLGSDNQTLRDDDPRQISHYRILRRLGQGGMGIVYLAQDENLNREVAIKILPPELAVREDLIERFSREAAAVSKLRHTSIVPIYEMGRDEALHFFVMPFIRGISLSGFVRMLKQRRAVKKDSSKPVSGPITEGAESEDISTAGVTEAATDLSRLLQIFETAAMALDHAHQQGIIHRDVKPSNILIDSDGHPHVLDFGLAKVVGLETQSISGKIMGTLPYMAPEQVTPNKGEVDARTDVYALGVTLYECICAQRPFREATTEALVYQILMKQPPSPREHVPELARDIETIILKCLEKDPARRYASARDLGLDLRRFREHRNIEARPVGKLGHLLRWAELNRMMAAFIAVSSVAIIVLLTLFLNNAYTSHQKEKKLKVYRSFIQKAEDARLTYDTLQRDLRESIKALALLESTVPGHEKATSLSKRELFVARANVKKLRRDIAHVRGKIDYYMQRSREAVQPINLEGEERIALYRKALAEAREEQNLRAQATVELFLKDAGVDINQALQGELTIVTNPPGAKAIAYPLKDDIAGIRQLDQSSSVDLGRTPVTGHTLEAGSWLVTLAMPEYGTTFVPVLIEPDQHWGSRTWHDGKFADKDWTITLPKDGSFSKKDWCLVPAGPFLAATESLNDGVESLEWHWLDSYLIARREVRFAQYEDFLRDDETIKAIIESSKVNSLKFVPRLEPWLPIFQIDGNGNLGPGATYGEMPARPYSNELVLTGISYDEIETFLSWLNNSKKENLRLPTSDEWQKAARGVDGRNFPWGDVFDWSYTHGRFSKEAPKGRVAWQYHAGPPNEYPVDTSPYGCMDMAGNAAEWCSNGPNHDGFKDQHWVMGGSFGWNKSSFFHVWPKRSYPYAHVDIQFGFRLIKELP